MIKKWTRQNKLHFINIALLLGICFFYFAPSFQGKTLTQSDIVGAQSTQTEINHYKAKGTTILWTNQIFGGMPTFQIWAPYNNNIATWVVKALTTTFPGPLYSIITLLLGSYFLFCVLKFNPWLAAAGATAFTFSSYNIILLIAGHANQVFAISFFAPLLAGIILIFRREYWLGGALTALFLALEIRANHVQMTYYLLLAILVFIVVELLHAIKSKTIPAFLKSILYLCGAVLIALLVNASLLWSTYGYSKETIRGPSNLTQQKPNKGLSRDYAYQYSQGISECLTFLIPNASGGGSTTEKADIHSNAAKILLNKGITTEQTLGLLKQISAVPGLSQYWGEKRPFTYGPHYFGAVICFLFVLGLLIVKNHIKWWLAITVLLTILLSLGSNWPPLSDLFFDYFPLYNRFRAVESILAVTALCFTILALLAAQEIINTNDKVALLKKLAIAFYIVCAILVFFILLPEVLLRFKTNDHAGGIAALTHLLKGDSITANSIANAIIRQRMHLEQADAIRSLVFVIITSGMVWAFIKQKINATFVSIGFFAIILVDLWVVDKRHLNYDSFKDKQASFKPRPRKVDRIILQDPDPYYRVVDLTQPPTYDLFSPFFHKAIWGYSEVRLKRFEEVLDTHFSYQVNYSILNMLNTKYSIYKSPKYKELQIRANKFACGHAWFVRKIQYVKNADEEIKAIGFFVPTKLAFIDEQYKNLVGNRSLNNDTSATIRLVNYNPDHLIYQSSSPSEQVAVFSEIYYDKGWKMYIDNKEQPYFRADYLLRAAVVPAGAHKIEFIFHPNSYYIGEDISLMGSVLLVALLTGVSLRKHKYFASKHVAHSQTA